MTTKKRKGPVLRSFDQFLMKRLQNKRFAVEYLKASLRDGDQVDFAYAVRDVIKARGNISEFAQRAGVTRKTIHKMLSGDGDLSFNSLCQILGALGGRFDVAPVPRRHALV